MDIMNVVDSNPILDGKNPVKATPIDNSARDIIASSCSLMTSNTNMTVKARKSGISSESS